jgi:hydrogenase maturation protein HypF
MKNGLTPTISNPRPQIRLRFIISGAVQGVGFRPFVYRLANELKLAGWVGNCTTGVLVELEGRQDSLDRFGLRLLSEKPPRSSIQDVESISLETTGKVGFEIRNSNDVGDKTTTVLPDLATCSECIGEILDPRNRRYLYPFTNCVNCGPRFSIIETLPYDRARTSMKRFTMCPECLSEFEDPGNRRFHAQPNGCPSCGPRIELRDAAGKHTVRDNAALLLTSDAVRDGKIAAVKGLGGFHLIVDAKNDKAVQRLRKRKKREEKPLALMYPSLERIKADCEVSDIEESLLTSPEAPIVLVARRKYCSPIASSVAPGNPFLGVMLPYTPLHHLLLNQLRSPVVATSGNLSGEPICADENEAIELMNGIADLFLIHDRPILRPIEDSIVRIVSDRPMLLRRARGYSSIPLRLGHEMHDLLATGAHMKSTVAVSAGRDAMVSQYIADLDTVRARAAFEQTIGAYSELLDFTPEAAACDLHPDYFSTGYAQELKVPVHRIQHHFAHVVSCMADNEIEGGALGVAWDGSGFGVDGTIWGGEFLCTMGDSFERAAHFRTFQLPGGDIAVREPRRAALGMLYEIFGDSLFAMSDLAPLKTFSADEQRILMQVLKRKLNAPVTSSAGRIFDAVASLLDVRHYTKFAGQAAMELEFALDGVITNDTYPLNVDKDTREGHLFTMVVDWESMILGILDDLNTGTPVARISAKFHNTLIEAIVKVGNLIGEKRIALTGGCFQNKYLTERAVNRLRDEGFEPFWHRRIPPNDGGIALGQLVAAGRLIRKEKT